jgi:hypothetical protein
VCNLLPSGNDGPKNVPYNNFVMLCEETLALIPASPNLLVDEPEFPFSYSTLQVKDDKHNGDRK